MRKYGVDQSNDRDLPRDHPGPILLWDIDKTYLDTDFSSLRALAKIPFERSVDKRSVPGSVPLLRGLRHGPGESMALVPLYFVSASPPQLRRVIEKRMTLDGVQFDGIAFKDQLGLLTRGRLREVLGRQVGYKLKALLLYRRTLPPDAPWLCFGDDAESDAEIFALFGKISAGLRGEALAKELERHRVHPTDVSIVQALSASWPVGGDPVREIYIHLAVGRDPESFDDERVVATESYLQTAIVLAHRGHIRPGVVTDVARDLHDSGFEDQTLRSQIRDVEERLDLPRGAYDALVFA